MHLAIAVFTIFAAWRWGDWRNWKQYQKTMYYIIIGGLLYEFLTGDYDVWVFQSDFLFKSKSVVVVYALVIMPLSILIFLSNYPRKWTKQILYNLKWVIIYIW